MRSKTCFIERSLARRWPHRHPPPPVPTSYCDDLTHTGHSMVTCWIYFPTLRLCSLGRHAARDNTIGWLTWVDHEARWRIRNSATDVKYSIMWFVAPIRTSLNLRAENSGSDCIGDGVFRAFQFATRLTAWLLLVVLVEWCFVGYLLEWRHLTNIVRRKTWRASRDDRPYALRDIVYTPSPIDFRLKKVTRVIGRSDAVVLVVHSTLALSAKSAWGRCQSSWFASSCCTRCHCCHRR